MDAAGRCSSFSKHIWFGTRRERSSLVEAKMRDGVRLTVAMFEIDVSERTPRRTSFFSLMCMSIRSAPGEAVQQYAEKGKHDTQLKPDSEALRCRGA